MSLCCLNPFVQYIYQCSINLKEKRKDRNSIGHAHPINVAYKTVELSSWQTIELLE